MEHAVYSVVTYVLNAIYSVSFQGTYCEYCVEGNVLYSDVVDPRSTAQHFNQTI